MDLFMADDWTKYPIAKRGAVQEPVDTKYDLEKLKELAIKMSTLPADKKILEQNYKTFRKQDQSD